jgi:hypothetical protein
MRYPDAAKIEGEGGTWEAFEQQLIGPQVPPGTYRARLAVDGEASEVSFEIQKDPRVSASQQDLEALFALALKASEKLSEVHQTINAIRRLRSQLDLWEARAKELGGQARLARAAATLRQKASAIEEELVQVRAKSRQDTLNYPAKLNAKLASLGSYIGSSDFAPTQGMRDVFEALTRRAEAQIARWRALGEGEVRAFDRLVRASRVPAIGAAAAPVARRPVRRAAKGRR